MLKALLAERFGLLIENGSRPVPRYVLSVGKGGSKLKPGSGSTGCAPKDQAGGRGGGPGDPASQPNIVVVCHNLTGAAIAENLHQMAGGYLDHDVIDSTQLEGTWDFELEWTARGALAAKGADGISVFDAVEKQLGLKLEVKNVAMPSLAIEKVNRNPTANSEAVATALATEPARFEAASIKLANPDKPPMTGLLYTGGSQMKAGGTLRAMIAMAFQIPPNVAGDVVIGLPKFADSQHWEILAKVPSTGEGAPNIVRGRPMPPPLSVGLEMLRGLLLDQFELKTHMENREVTVYALTVGSRKPKMAQAEESERSSCRPDPGASKPVTTIGMMIGCKNRTMADLAKDLQMMANGYIDHPIVDATGLAGGWNFAIGWTPKQMTATPPPVPSANANQTTAAMTEASDPNSISVFEAVDLELGLKLVKQKRSIPVIVVDHLSEKPIQ
jgi:uncharacterized protein (TIGR03435 family)